MALGRWTSRSLQVLGFAGLLVSLALAIAILLGRSFVAVAVGDVFVAADTSIGNGLATVDDASARLSEGVGRLDELVAESGVLAAAPPIPAAVAARISTVVDAYAPARDRFVAARERALVGTGKRPGRCAVDTRHGGPHGVPDALAAANDRLVAIDGALDGPAQRCPRDGRRRHHSGDRRCATRRRGRSRPRARCAPPSTTFGSASSTCTGASMASCGSGRAPCSPSWATSRCSTC